MEQISMFTAIKREEKLSRLGDCLEKLNGVIDWESFRPALAEAMARSPRLKGGRRPYDDVLMFKILILQRIFNLSDDQTEYQINDRISFMRFLDISVHDTVPDAKTIWLYRETLAKKGMAKKLFEQFNEMLEAHGLITHTGSIVDASFVDMPKTGLKRAEMEIVKEGELPEKLQGEEHKAARSQFDADARFGKKYGETHYGYKDSVKVDVDSKLIVNYSIVAANVEDCKAFIELLDDKDRLLYGDKGYYGKSLEAQFPPNVKSMILDKALVNHPLTEEQKESNRQKSKVRARVEHVFGYMKKALHGMTIRSKSKTRARFGISLLNLTYNLFRYAFLKRTQPTAG